MHPDAKPYARHFWLPMAALALLCPNDQTNSAGTQEVEAALIAKSMASDG
jgi:hypothetical protein